MLYFYKIYIIFHCLVLCTFLINNNINISMKVYNRIITILHTNRPISKFNFLSQISDND